MFYGLALLAHIQNILLLPFFAFYLFETNGRAMNNRIIYSSLIVVSLFSLLVIIPLLWETNSIQSIFFENANFQQKVVSIDPGLILKGFLKSTAYFLYNFSIFGIFILHGCILLFRENKIRFIILALATLPFCAFALRFDVPDNYVFFLQPYIVLVIVSGYSYDIIMKKYSFASGLIPLQLLLLPLFYFTMWQISMKIPSLNGLHQQKAYKGGMKYLLWPGMKDNADLLQLSKKIYLTNQKPQGFEEFEWNYLGAIRFLKQNGELKKDN